MPLAGLPASAVDGGDDAPQASCCCGLVPSFRTATWLVSLFCMYNGLLPVAVAAYNETGGQDRDKVFRWGPRSYERSLERVGALVGVVCFFFGLLGVRGVRNFALRDIYGLKCFLRVYATWVAMWFLFVGLPTEIVYVPAPSALPAPLRAFTTPRLVVDADWPYGMPSLCVDVLDLKSVLKDQFHTHISSTRSAPVGAVLDRIGNALFRRIIPDCRGAMRIFMIWMTASVSLWIYCAWVVSFFHKMVLHGEDGALLLSRLHLNSRYSSKALTEDQLRQAVDNIFIAADSNKDGFISREEYRRFLEANSLYFKHVRE